MTRCNFQMAWIGQCKEAAINGNMCEKHASLKCSSCGKPATKDCDETMGLVCGYPLCEECEHTTQSNGCNSGGQVPHGYKGHCKCTDQVYKPWYSRENDTDIFLNKEEQ